MIYSDLIKMAIHELNIPKYRFAEEIGISATKLYRILRNEIIIPSDSVLLKLDSLGIDISELDYNEIYYEYISNRYPDFQWSEDIYDGAIKLKHTKCNSILSFALKDIKSQSKVVCPYCDVKEPEKTNVREDISREKSEPKPEIIYIHGEKAFKVLGTQIISGYKSSKLESLRIPNWVTEIAPGAFESCASLKKLYIPGNIKVISKDAFCYCYGLQEVTIASGVREIEVNAFLRCGHLKKVYIPDTLEKIATTAFTRCSKATFTIDPYNRFYKTSNSCLIDIRKSSVFMVSTPETSLILDIPEGIKRIENFAISNLDALVSVHFPQSLEYIGAESFYRCRNLKEIFIPKNVNHIGSDTFCECLSIKRVIIDLENSTYRSQDNCIIKTEDKMIVRGFCVSEIPNDGSVTGIASSAFSNVYRSSPLKIPKEISKIERIAFRWASFVLRRKRYGNSRY